MMDCCGKDGQHRLENVLFRVFVGGNSRETLPREIEPVFSFDKQKALRLKSFDFSRNAFYSFCSRYCRGEMP